MSVRKVQRFTEQDIQRVVARGVRSQEAGIAAAWAAQGVPTASSRSGQAQGSGSGVDPTARSAKQMKPKTCKVCRERFTPVRTIQPTCGEFTCLVEYAHQVVAKSSANKARKEAKAHREAKVKAKTLTEWLNEAQTIVNKYIRLRDARQPCISCGTTADVQYAAGHYRSRGSASHLRFNHDNLHKQCNRHCNMALSGNQRNYRTGLIARIGADRVEALENDNTPHKWTIDEAKAVIAQHKLLIKGLA